MSNSVSEMFESVMKGIDSFVSSKKVVGEAITAPDGTVILPISQVSIGFGGGGSDFDSKRDSHFGGGMGGGVKITPDSFLIINNGNVRLINTGGTSSPLDKVIDLVPGMVDKVNGFFAGRGKDFEN